MSEYSMESVDVEEYSCLDCVHCKNEYCKVAEKQLDHYTLCIFFKKNLRWMKNDEPMQT